MRVTYFGTYERTYPRNAQVISALRRVGVEVVEHHRPVWEARKANWSAGPAALARLGLAELSLLARSVPRSDALIVGYPGHLDLPVARIRARGRPLVFNPLVSLEDTLVDDRGRFPQGSWQARVLRAVDRRAFAAADAVVADTSAHADHLAARTGVPRGRFAVCLVGAEDRLFTPGWSQPDSFTALFVGKLIPLHGLETILEAARLAPELAFRIVGSGQLDHLLADPPANVEWVRWVEYEQLPAELRRASCALGIFGTSGKAGRVIPNKAFQALACGTPLVTGDTPGARELLIDDESALLVPPGDAGALARALRRLAAEPDTARRIGQRGREVYERDAGEEVLGSRWRGVLEGLL